MAWAKRHEDHQGESVVRPDPNRMHGPGRLLLTGSRGYRSESHRLAGSFRMDTQRWLLLTTRLRTMSFA